LEESWMAIISVEVLGNAHFAVQPLMITTDEHLNSRWQLWENISVLNG